MKALLLVSVSICCTIMFIDKASAGLGLPNIGECYKSARDQDGRDYCEALESCMQNDTDDRASLKGCILEAQDRYTAKAMQGESVFPQSSNKDDQSIFRWADLGISPTAPEDFPIETLEVNSELVGGIQGEKGWTQQQQGPND